MAYKCPLKSTFFFIYALPKQPSCLDQKLSLSSLRWPKKMPFFACCGDDEKSMQWTAIKDIMSHNKQAFIIHSLLLK